MKASTNKRDIGAAFKALKVNEPYNLKHTKPAFVQPEPVVSTLVTPDTMVDTETMVSANAMVALPTKVPTQTKEAVVTNPLVAEPSLVTQGTMAPTPTKDATKQNSAIQFEAKAASGLEKGYTRIPNALLMQIVQGNFIRSEVMLLLLIARFTVSFNRKVVPLSKAVFERQTGLRGPAILEALDGLLKKGAIVKEKGNHNQPSEYGLAVQIENCIPSTTKTMVAEPTKDCTQTKAPVQSLAPPVTMVAEETNTLVPSATPFKNNINIINNLSPSSFTSPLPKISAREITNYLSSIKAPKKRESEMQACENLLNAFSEEQVASALNFILGNGCLSDQTPCHSPMKYLSVTMDQVLEAIKIEAEAKQMKQEKQALLAAQKQQQLEQENLDEQLANKREKAFLQAFPAIETQQEVITEYTPVESKLLPERIQRILAIEKWFGSVNLNATQGGI